MIDFFVRLKDSLNELSIVAICLLLGMTVLWLNQRSIVKACRSTPACYAKIIPVYDGDVSDRTAGWRGP